MPLDSTEALSKVLADTHCDEQESSGPEVGVCPQVKDPLSWCYIYTHQAKVPGIIEKLEERFTVFIHKTTVHHKKSHIKTEEKPTISGLVFVQGRTDDIQEFLHNHIPNIYLVKDCSTGKPAIISNKVMSAFMQLSALEPDRIRFMPHPFDHYSSGHVKVKLTSGALSGMEGYIVRISRNRCLITSVGGLTIAISGIHKETFENVEELKDFYCEHPDHPQVSEIIDQIYRALSSTQD